MNKLPKTDIKYRDKEQHQRIVVFIGTYKEKGELLLTCAEHYLDHEGRQITAPNKAFFVKPHDFWEYLEECK